MSVGVSSDGDGGLLSFPSGSFSFSNDGAVTMVGGVLLVSIGGDATMSAGSSAGGNGRTARFGFWFRKYYRRICVITWW